MNKTSTELPAWVNTVIHGDALEQLKLLPDKSVHCCVTSPPYWFLRDYQTGVWEGGNKECSHKPSDTAKQRGIASSSLSGGKNNTGHKHEGYKSVCSHCGAIRIDKQLGLEKTPEKFIENMVSVFREVKRVLIDDGSAWINMGDSYSNGSNFLDSFNAVNEFSSICFADAFSIRISCHSIEVPLNNDFFKNQVFISLFGIERIFIKKRQNDFCKVFNLFNAKGYAVISGPFSLVKRNDTTLEIIFNEMDNISIIHSDLDSDLDSVFGISTSEQRSCEQINTTLTIKEAGKPITESIISLQSVRYAITIDSAFKSIVDVDFVDDPISFTNGFTPSACDFGNLIVRKAGIEQVNFLFTDLTIDFTSVNVTHLLYNNLFGSFVTHRQIYDSANKRTNELAAKQEIGMPEQLKRALMQDGWICRQTIIWHKTNCMPESCNDRCTKNQLIPISVLNAVLLAIRQAVPGC